MMVESQGVGRLMIVAPKEFNWEDLLQTLPKDRGKVARDRMLGATREVADEYIEELLAEADALERAKVCGALREHCALACVVALIIAAPRLLDQQAAGGRRPATCRASLGVSTMQEDKLSGLGCKTGSEADCITGNSVIDNVLTDGGHFYQEGCGVLAQDASDSIISHNEISNFRYSGISTGWTWGYAETVVSNISTQRRS